MKDAAIKLYSETRGSKHQLATIAESLSGWNGGRTVPGSPDDILNYMAYLYRVFKENSLYLAKEFPRMLLNKLAGKM